MGIACHLGLELGLPTVGCGKTRLTGSFVEPGPDRGNWSALIQTIGGRERAKREGMEIGRVLRTRAGVKPVFISPGHLCGIEAAVDLALKCCTRYRLPDPIRAAHNLAGEARRKAESSH